MKQILQLAYMGLAIATIAGCSNISMPSIGSILGGEDSTIRVSENNKKNSATPLLKYAVSIRVARYTDSRKSDNPRKIGTGAENVTGMSGKDIVLDQDVATVVTEAMKSRLDDAGFQVSESQNGNALFELSGVVKELTYDVKARDEVNIAIETTLKEVNTDKVVWSGLVIEKNDRFAGVSGNNKNDVTRYLRRELGIVTEKTTEAISASMMMARPELFNLTPGTKAIPGVTVLVAPTPVNIPVTPALPVPPVERTPAPVPAAPVLTYVPEATATSGLLLINTNPARAKVYLDSVYYGLSPLRLEMEPGIHNLSVKLEGYKMVFEKVSVRKGDSTEMNLSLEH